MSACAAASALTPDQQRLHVESFDDVWSTVRDKKFDPTPGGLDWNAVRAGPRPKVERAKSGDQVRAILSETVGRLKQSRFQILPAGIKALVKKQGSGTITLRHLRR